MEAEQHNTPTPEISIVPDADPIDATDFPKGDAVVDYLLADIEQRRTRKILTETLQHGVKLRNKLYKVIWRPRPAFKVIDPTALPPEFTVQVPDREKIMSAVLKGREIPGVEREILSLFPVVSPKGKLKKRRDSALK